MNIFYLSVLALENWCKQCRHDCFRNPSNEKLVLTMSTFGKDDTPDGTMEHHGANNKGIKGYHEV